jgi:hypothetical protein
MLEILIKKETLKGRKSMKRRDFLKFGSAGLAGVTFGGLTRSPIFRIGKVFAQPSSSPWSFGVMGDTQWTTTNYDDPAGTNPNSVAASIIDQINPQFVDLGVKFVIQVGDLTDEGIDAGIVTRATHCQDLYNNGIGFFPIRGNHETYGGEYGPLNNYAIPAIQANFPQTQGNGTTWDATNFSSATDSNGNPISDLQGIAYSFDYGATSNNARFLMLDFWATQTSNPASTSATTGIVNADGYSYGYTVAQQQAWISNKLNSLTRGTEHAFVFGHQPLMAESHQDTMFSGYTNANPAWQNAFYNNLVSNGVKYYISGHDHIHQRSIIASPDGTSQVEELICASCSSKFYTPVALSNANWFGQKTRETSISQELYTVGFYVFTIDGPTVTVDFYSDTHGNWYSSGDYPNNPSGSGLGLFVTPTFSFTKKETWGYTSGQTGLATFELTQGSGYKLTFGSTTAHVNKTSATAQDYTGRSLTKDAAAWWAPQPSSITGGTAISDVLTLLGASAGAIKETEDSNPYNPNDPVAITMTYDPSVTLTRADLDNGYMISLNTMDANGNWVNAVNLNYGGHSRFVYGAWNKTYPLGTYGVDNTNHIAWAVVNHDSDFVVVKNW